MKTLLCLPLFTVCTLSLVFAENTFSIGNDVFLLEFEHIRRETIFRKDTFKPIPNMSQSPIKWLN